MNIIQDTTLLFHFFFLRSPCYKPTTTQNTTFPGIIVRESPAKSHWFGTTNQTVAWPPLQHAFHAIIFANMKDGCTWLYQLSNASNFSRGLVESAEAESLKAMHESCLPSLYCNKWRCPFCGYQLITQENESSS
jgi:hypothetical protein